MIKGFLLAMIVTAVKRLISSDVFEQVSTFVNDYAEASLSGDEKRAKVQADMREWLRRRAKELPGVLVNLAIETAVLKLRS